MDFHDPGDLAHGPVPIPSGRHLRLPLNECTTYSGSSRPVADPGDLQNSAALTSKSLKGDVGRE